MFPISRRWGCRRLLFSAGVIFLLAAAGCGMMTASTNMVALGTSPVVTAPLGDAEKVPDIQMVLHGNWCGPNHPSAAEVEAGTAAPPVDPLDTACMKHDMCYLANGNKPVCRCDRELIWRIKYLQYHAKEFSADARMKAFMMLAWFEDSPCSDPAVDRSAKLRSLRPPGG